MFTKMTTVAATVGLLVAGAMAKSYPVAPSGPPAAGHPVPYPAAAIGIPGPHGSNDTAPVWAYFNSTATSVEVVQALTTHCSRATTLTFNGIEYPATKGEIITVTNCPCTVTRTHPTLTSSICPPTQTKPSIPGPPPVEIVPVPTTPATGVPPYPTSTPIYPSVTPPIIHVGAAAEIARSEFGLFVFAVTVAAAVAVGV